MTTFMKKFKPKRKLLLALPLLVLPFVTLLFWGLGGGAKSKQPAPPAGGLNVKLPSPELQEGFGNKLSLYEQANRDSLRWADERRSAADNIMEDTNNGIQAGSDYYAHERETAGAEQKIQDQLALLQKKIDESQQETDMENAQEPISLPSDTNWNAAWSMTDMPLSANDQADPEIARLDGMLQKILDIQHPERVAEQLQEKSREQRGIIFPVQTKSSIPAAQLLQPDEQQGTAYD